MGKGHLGSAKKSSNYRFKKRCQHLGCKKKAKYQVGDSFFCKIHWYI